MIKIQDVIVPTRGTGKYFQIKLINLNIPGTDATFYWNVLSEIFTEEQSVPGSILLEGNLHMPQDIYVGETFRATPNIVKNGESLMCLEIGLFDKNPDMFYFYFSILIYLIIYQLR